MRVVKGESKIQDGRGTQSTDTAHPLSHSNALSQLCFVPFAVVLALTLFFTAFYLPETLGRTVQARSICMCLCMYVV